MGDKDILKVEIRNLLSSLIIAIVTTNILSAFGLKGGMYLGNLFGLYFLVVYGLNNFIDAHKFSNNFFRFIVAIAYIYIFDILFLFIIPLLFGPNIFPPTEVLTLDYNGVKYDIFLTKEFYLALFAVVILIFNFLLYRKTKYYHSE